MHRTAALSILLLALAGCGRDAQPTTATAAATQQAEVRIGDVVVRASAAQASTLAEDFTRENGLERSDRIVMLLVSVRRADGTDASGLPVTVTARAVADGGAPEPVSLREIHVDGLVDRIGTVDIAPPETLRFDVSIRYGTSTSTAQFTRTFFPR